MIKNHSNPRPFATSLCIQFMERGFLSSGSKGRNKNGGTMEKGSGVGCNSAGKPLKSILKKTSYTPPNDVVAAVDVKDAIAGNATEGCWPGNIDRKANDGKAKGVDWKIL
ncbi:hypothetical protein Tco_1507827 [Tanacetum coccineum]